jgi:hypothetical protein
MSFALALTVSAVIASLLTLNGRWGSLKGHRYSAPPEGRTAARPSRDDVVRGPVGAGPPPKDGADPADVGAGHSAEQPVGSRTTASTGSASPLARPLNALDPKPAAPAAAGTLGDGSTSKDAQFATPEPRVAGMPITPPVSSVAESKESLPDSAQSIPIVAGPAGEASTGSTTKDAQPEPQPTGAPAPTSVPSVAESTKAPLGDEASQGPVAASPRARAEKAGAEQPLGPKDNPTATRQAVVSGSAAVAKIETTGPSVPASSRPRSAHAPPKREKGSKTRRVMQAPVAPPPPQPSTGAPPLQPEQAAQQGNPLLRALRAAVESSPPQQAKLPPPLPVGPTTQPGNPLLRAVSDAFER